MMPSADPAGAPYHALAAVLSGHGRFRMLVETVLVASFWFVLVIATSVAVAVLAVVSGVDVIDLQPVDPAWYIASVALGLATAIPAAQLGARWIQRRPIGSLSSVAGRLRWRWLLVCAGWAACALGLIVAAGYLLDPGLDMSQFVGWPTFGPTLAVIALAIPLQAAGEEYLLRGWLLQAVAGRARTPWPAILIGAALFTLLHGTTDPVVAAELAVFGVAAGWATARTGGLEAAIALHVVNNVVGLGLDSADGSVVWADAAHGDPASAVISAAVILGYAWWIIRVARRRGVATTA